MVQVAHRAQEVFEWHIDPAVVESLIDEAAGIEFTRIVGTKFGAKISPRRITSPFDLASAPGGEVAGQVAASDEAATALRQLTTDELALTATTYVLYDTASFIGLHTDRSGCDLNLLIALVGAPTTFEFFPALVDEPAPAVFDMAKEGSGFITGGNTIELPIAGASVAFVGSVLPHQRRHTSEPVLMLSLCYHFGQH